MPSVLLTQFSSYFLISKHGRHVISDETHHGMLAVNQHLSDKQLQQQFVYSITIEILCMYVYPHINKISVVTGSG